MRSRHHHTIHSAASAFAGPAFGAQIDDVVRCLDHLEIVLDR